jgi:hypothetical protein
MGIGCIVAEGKEQLEISALYLELASECFSKAATAQDAGAADVLQQMARSYFAQAVALNPSLSGGTNSQEETRKTLGDQ